MRDVVAVAAGSAKTMIARIRATDARKARARF